jgi:hypothetical protein
MPALKTWFHVVTPREDLRGGRPLDASEFAVHLDHVRQGRETVHRDYLEPGRFFERTYFTRNLSELAVQAVRRLSGLAVETSAVFNMATQFGGGKTHALLALYHLAEGGPKADGWHGVSGVLSRAGVSSVPKARTAVFVGTEFDSLDGRGGPGEPRRKTPWGEMAWQLGGPEGYAAVAEHDQRGVAPGGDVIRRFLPQGPTLLLMDELMNYISRSRKMGLAAELYNFLHNLSEEARARNNVVLAVSIPASELEMNAEDRRDYEALKKMLDRLGKAILMSAEAEAAEIIRRRLFEWYGLPDEARKTARAYAAMLEGQRHLVGDFDVDTAREKFLACYPFHPALLSVFERKWQSLPRFQKTRGVLRLLALWVSRAYQEEHRRALKDPLLSLGSAPLEDSMLRSALLEQLGNPEMEGPVTTDIAGKKDSHAVRLDRKADDAIRKARLHQKVATAILFESNGGQTRAEATVPEVRLAVAEPDLDIGNVETVLEALTASCYYLSVDRDRYRFSLTPNLVKLFNDRHATIQPKVVAERARQEVEAVFKPGPPVPARKFFPEKSGDVNDQAVLTLVVLDPRQELADAGTRTMVEQIVKDHGSSGRTFKSALLFAVADNGLAIEDEARKLLAWEEIADDGETVKQLDDKQVRQLDANRRKAARDLRDAVWRAYKNVLLLARNGTMREIDLVAPNSSAANSLVEFILLRLKTEGEITDAVGAKKLVNNYWPAGMEAWSTRAVRDAFYASPALPRLLDAGLLKRTIVDGVTQGDFAYARRDEAGRFDPLYLQTSLGEADVEFSEEMVLLRAADARKYVEPPRLARIEVLPAGKTLLPGGQTTFTVAGYDQHGRPFPCGGVTWSTTGGQVNEKGLFVAGEPGTYTIRASAGGVEGTVPVAVTAKKGPGPDPDPLPARGLRWHGSIPHQKWTTFYMKVLTGLASTPGLRLDLTLSLPPGDTATEAKVEQIKAALRELGLADEVERPS